MQTTTQGTDNHGNATVTVLRDGRTFARATLYQYGPRSWAASIEGIGWTDMYRSQSACTAAIVRVITSI